MQLPRRIFIQRKRLATLVFVCFVTICAVFNITQDHAKSSVSTLSRLDSVVNPTDHEEDSWSFVELFNHLESSEMIDRYACKVSAEFGGYVINDNSTAYKDGHKVVCLDEGVRPALNDCLVYSFGIEDEWSFDDDMAKLGCEVYAFDPSMQAKDHNRSARVHFYQEGLWFRKQNLVVNDYPGVYWEVDTLSSFYDRFKTIHGDRPIDYVKIDIESDEWYILPQIMSSGILNRVKQLAMEIHFMYVDIEEARRRVKILKSLERDHGMIPFAYTANLVTKGMAPDAPDNFACAEIVYLNPKFRLKS